MKRAILEEIRLSVVKRKRSQRFWQSCDPSSGTSSSFASSLNMTAIPISGPPRGTFVCQPAFCDPAPLPLLRLDSMLPSIHVVKGWLLPGTDDSIDWLISHTGTNQTSLTSLIDEHRRHAAVQASLFLCIFDQQLCKDNSCLGESMSQQPHIQILQHAVFVALRSFLVSTNA